jgi:endonuclease-3 related protein
MTRHNGSGALLDIYRRLDAAYNAEVWHWFPPHARGPMDIIAGAILVQHTNWKNAERGLEALRAARALDPRAIVVMPEDRLVELVRVSGTPTVKARRLRALSRTILDEGGLGEFLALPIETMRPLLLATHGVGPETADAIALYAAGRRTFVVDVYTRRVFRRVGIAPDTGDRYDDWRAFFEESLPQEGAALFQRYHAWIVLHAKARCRTAPSCEGCPLFDVCDFGRSP